MCNRPEPTDRNASHAGGVATQHLLTWTVSALCVLLTVAWHARTVVLRSERQDVAGLGYVPLTTIWDGGFTGLFTAVFVHGVPHSLGVTLIHLGFNLLWLIALGRLLEESLHPLFWAGFFVAAAVVTSGVEIAASSKTAIGASGVVYAMFGLMYTGRGRHPEWRIVAHERNLRILVLWGLACVVATTTHLVAFANAAHFGGLLFGLAIGTLAFTDRLRVVAGTIVAVLSTLTVLSVVWMPWSLPWTEWNVQRQVRAGSTDSAVGELRRSILLGADPAFAWRRIAALEAGRGNQRAVLNALRQAEQYEHPPARKPGAPRGAR